MDPFSILGVTPSATWAEVRRAYRALARRHHPDVNPGPHATGKMRHINWAYETLSDPSKRAYYEMSWRAAHQANWGRPVDTDTWPPKRPPQWTPPQPRAQGSGESARRAPPSSPPPQSESPRGYAWEYSGQGRSRGAETEQKSGRGKVLILGLLILWLVRSLAAGIGGPDRGSRDPSLVGSSSLGGSTLADDPLEDYYGADLLIAEWEGQRIDGAYNDLYRDVDEAYADHLADLYSDLDYDYGQYEGLEDEAYMDDSLDYYADDWPSYP